MGDETVKIFLNAKGTLNDIGKELKTFLDYVAGQKPEDTYVKRLETAVKKARKNKERRHEYMTLLMRDRENQRIGKEIGKEIGKIYGAISVYKDLKFSEEEIITKLQTKFDLTEEEASQYLEEVE